MIITVEVEPNDNCLDLPMQVFQALEEPWRVARVKVYQPGGSDAWCRVTSWSSDGGGTPGDAYCAKVGDSGSGFAFLVHGGDWGLRLMPADLDEPWSMESPNQWGEAYLLLSELDDIEPA